MDSKPLTVLFSKHVYLIAIEPCEEGGFFASCAGLQGCHADGESYDEVIKNISEVISLRG